MSEQNTIKKQFNPLMWSVIICMPIIIVAFTVIITTLIISALVMGIIYLILNLFKTKKKINNPNTEKEKETQKFEIDLTRFKNYFDKKINIK